MSIVKINDLSFGYTSQGEVLKNINLDINEGEFVCIVGENGSGKSTLAKCIVGLNKTEKSKIEVMGQIGYLAQITEHQNNFPATVEEIVLSGTIVDSIKSIFYKKSDKQKATEVMKKLDLYEIRKRCFMELSGGQKQRVLIARALCSTKEILVLDEPVNGLDPKIVSQVYDILKKLNEDEKMTIIMISHDIERAVKYSSKVIQMSNGEITKVSKSNEYKEDDEK